ncbi:MAG: alpha/beta hydrolase family protein [bacterium]|jgi:hypothetical protein
MKYFSTISLLLAGLILMSISTLAQPEGTNYDESKVPQYELPDPLTMSDGTKVTTAEQWKNQRRPELLKLFETHVYGKTPEQEIPMQYDVSTEENALDGKAIRKQITISPKEGDNDWKMDMLLYLPKNAPRPVPVFLGLNFQGNHTIHSDPGIRITDTWMNEKPRNRRAIDADPEDTRAVASSRWPLEMILDRGYGLATIWYYDIDPDYDDNFQNGVHPLFYKEGQTKPAADQWGSIGAWAWGLSRAMDYLVQDSDINENQVALLGHSRLGKTSLWAGAQDERFAFVISNNSGCGGAALSRRQFGETVRRINTSFPHWFCDNFNKYNDKESELPVDQHELIALIAPRPVYIASAEEDQWADPRGEFLSGKHASPVYELLGEPGLQATDMPPVNQPVQGTINYHIRTGKHDVTDYDWEQYLNTADRFFRK